MKARSSVEIELVKLVNGERLLRLTEPRSGLTLEKKLAKNQPVLRQQNKLLAALEAARLREELVAS